MAGLEDDVDDAVRAVFFRVVAQQLQTARVGGHYGAGDREVLFGQRVERGDLLADPEVRAFEVAAVFKSDDDRGAVGGFKDVDDLFERFAHRAAGDEDAVGGDVLAALSVDVVFQYFVDKLVYLRNALFVVEGKLEVVRHEHDLLTRYDGVRQL
ncbi:hypothetical protein SDC9_202017 [bioreactor metagenome]|uniref:Uncharacterized protein n=1 Tax=bioreactor metagenome TaxID=1076179 RepID=A0A645ISZ3_9ZZZZ